MPNSKPFSKPSAIRAWATKSTGKWSSPTRGKRSKGILISGISRGPMKFFALLLILMAGKLDAKLFSELENVQGVLGLYTMVDGIRLEPSRAMLFYTARG